MTWETALALSRTLAELGVGHKIEVGHHGHVAPEGETALPEIHCRVDVPIPRRYSGGIGQAVRALEGAADEHGLVLATSMMAEGLTFSTRKNVAEAETLLKWPGESR